MKTNFLYAIFLCLALSAQAQQSIVCDVAKANAFPISITATVDTDVTATILQNGVESPLAGYTGLFYFGDSSGGVTITNSATGYNTFSWTIPAESTPTNGVYSVQILSAKDGRVKELGRGRMTVRANPSTDYIPVQWQTNNMAYMIAALARDIAIQANNTASNALIVANQALANSGISSNDVLSLSGGLLAAHNTNTASHADIRLEASNGISNHNVSAVSHSDIRASVSNAVDLATGAIKTNSVGGLAIGDNSTASYFSVAYGFGATASGSFSQAFGFLTTASGLYSASYGNQTYASGDYSFSAGQGASAAGRYSMSLGNQSQALEDGSVALGFASVSSNKNALTWSGIPPYYYSHGEGTFNINPVNGTSGFYIGETNLQTFLDQRLLASTFYSSNSLTASSISALYASNVTTSARIDGKLSATYDTQFHTYDIQLEQGVVGQLFQESHVWAMNRSGATIGNGKVVCVSGAQGDNVLIEPASASNPVCTWNVIGLVTEDAGITNNTSGYVCTFGNVNDLNTSMFAVSNTLWLTENGNVTNVEPAIVVGKSKIKIGTVIRSHANEGRIFVSPQVIPNASDVGAMSTSERTNYYTKAEDDIHDFYKPIANSSSAITSTISIIPSVKVYKLTTTNSTTITFDTSALNTTNQVATWELWVLNTSTNNSIVWPSTNVVYYLATPSSISANSQTIFTVWRKFGETIQCNPYLVK